MLYSSGTTGRPKGVLRPLPELPPWGELPLFEFLTKQWRYREGMVYLSPAPLYHAAPQAAVSLAIRMGGTAVIMERFDPERFLQLVEKYRVTHSQLVPTMFSRMLKLPEEVRRRYDLSSLECAVHAAAPCPIPVKEQMIEWWGPIIDEYYGATEGLGFTACDSAEWLAHNSEVCCRRKHGFEFGELLVRAVLTLDAGGSHELADDRIERAVLVIRRAMVLQPRMRLGLEPLQQRSREARLADARLAGDQHDAPFAGLGLLPAPHQQIELLVSPEQRRRPMIGSPRLEAVLQLARAGAPGARAPARQSP